jgi:hypothetical protein
MATLPEANIEECITRPTVSACPLVPSTTERVTGDVHICCNIPGEDTVCIGEIDLLIPASHRDHPDFFNSLETETAVKKTHESSLYSPRSDTVQLQYRDLLWECICGNGECLGRLWLSIPAL